MKKIVSIFTFSIFLFACKKEKEVVAPVNNTVTGLEGNFKFASSLTDETGKGTATGSGTFSFTADRKGVAGNALQLDGGSKLTISNIYQGSTGSSISVWVALDNLSTPLKYFVCCTANGLAMSQSNTSISGTVSVPTTASAYTNCADNNWHHYAVTYDGADVKIYKDGVLAGTTNNPGILNAGEKSFVLGYFNNAYWKGRIDELKIYSRLLSTEEITKLAQE